MGNPVIRRSLLVVCVLFAILVLLSAGCSKSSSDDAATTAPATSNSQSKPGGPLEYLPKPLDFTAGQPGSIQLDATGGKPPYIWRGKAGSLLPSSFSLNSKGVLSGTPPDLSGGVTQTTLPPYIAILMDSSDAQIEVELNINIIAP